MQKIILHADLDNFFASVECLLNPDIAGEPVCVCGDEDMRHGIVLAKNNLAKRTGIKTGQTLYSARKMCPSLVCVPANYENYVKYSSLVRKIYERYTPQIEPFGLDEAWLDVSSRFLETKDGGKIAEKIRSDVKKELGLCLSIGISYNKIFAKLGSDMGKPDGTALITKENYKEKVWPLPVRELFFVGKATEEKLMHRGISTIGALARAKKEDLKKLLGKPGETLWIYANGMDASPVSLIGAQKPMKSIGNSVTTYRDLVNMTDIKNVLYMLAEKVARRMREEKVFCSCVHFSLRYKDLTRFEMQHKLEHYTNTAADIAENILLMLKKQNFMYMPIRSFGIRVSGLEKEENVRPSFFENTKMQKLERAIDELYKMYGDKRPVRAITMMDKKLTGFDEKRRQVFSAVDNSEQTKHL